MKQKYIERRRKIGPTPINNSIKRREEGDHGKTRRGRKGEKEAPTWGTYPVKTHYILQI
jgi:hypothetical protein